MKLPGQYREIREPAKLWRSPIRMVGNGWSPSCSTWKTGSRVGLSLDRSRRRIAIRYGNARADSRREEGGGIPGAEGIF
ncbi:MAG: hypothetical protein M1297_02905 [Nitrospirae bacterium]|nr:hypothetical protein [Nitrospirota bacterium]